MQSVEYGSRGGIPYHICISATVRSTFGVFGPLGPSSISLWMSIWIFICRDPPPGIHHPHDFGGSLFSTSFQTPPKPPQVQPMGPKMDPRPPKCLQNGGRSEPWRVPKNVFVSISVKKCRPLQNLIISTVSSRFALVQNHVFFVCDFGSQKSQENR